MHSVVRLPRSFGWYSLAFLPLLFGAVALLAGCSSGSSSQAGPPPRNPALKVDSRLVGATNDFAFRLNQQLVAQSGQGNVFFSPVSVDMAFSLLANGAQGQTASDIATTLGTQQLDQGTVNSQNANLLAILHNPDQYVTLNIANGLWANKAYSYNASFLKAAQQWYGANPQYLTLGPTSAAPIDAWVSAQTAGMIPQLFSSSDIAPGAVFVLANAIYFKGSWTTPFNPINTTAGPFTLSDGSTESLPFMSVTAQFSLLDTPDFQGVDLPYSNKYVSMLAIEPKAGKTLADILPELTSANWAQWQTMQSSCQMTVQLPRFSASFSSSLIPSLTAMGMGSAFDPTKGFTSILSSPSTPIFISVVKHQAVLNVDETGTTAAAATGAVGVASVAPLTTVVRFDHPFVVIIHDNPTGTILFIGEIGAPQ